jgi:hypothetical protein
MIHYAKVFIISYVLPINQRDIATMRTIMHNKMKIKKYHTVGTKLQQ